jgi:hypothetical protein
MSKIHNIVWCKPQQDLYDKIQWNLYRMLRTDISSRVVTTTDTGPRHAANSAVCTKMYYIIQELNYEEYL